MPDSHDIGGDARLVALCRAALPSPADNGFTAAVVGRIRRRTWIRRAVLGAAAIIGGLLAFRPAWELSRIAGDTIAGFLSRWAQIDLSGDYRMIGIALLAVFLGPLLVSMLEE